MQVKYERIGHRLVDITADVDRRWIAESLQCFRQLRTTYENAPQKTFAIVWYLVAAADGILIP
jgi:hypothetical protein